MNNQKMTYTMSANKHDVLAMCTRSEAEKIFKHIGVVFSDMVVVDEWNFVPDTIKEGFGIFFDGEDINPDNEMYYAPVISGAKVDWRFAECYLLDAYKIMGVFRDDNPRVLSAKIASPLWIELAIDEQKRKPEDLVILIAPILPNDSVINAEAQP